MTYAMSFQVGLRPVRNLCVALILGVVEVCSAETAASGPVSAAPESRLHGSRVTDLGVLIEPSLRMHYAGGPFDYEIRIALPASYHQTDKSYPVLWVTDGS